MNKKMIEELRKEYGYSPLKKVYVPTGDELYKMQDMGANIYKYLVVKAAEVLMAQGVNYPQKGMLQDAFKTLRRNPDLVRAVCFLYPEQINFSELEKYDTKLCLELIERFPNIDGRIRNLDKISYFENNIGNNVNVSKNAISILAEELSKDPKYRFEFRSSKLLDDIFSRKIDINNYYMEVERTANQLMSIEPAYALLDEFYQYLGGKETIYIPTKKEEFNKKISNYAKRYCISEFAGEEYKGKDILTNPNPEVKRLIRCINDRKDVLYNGKIKL